MSALTKIATKDEKMRKQRLKEREKKLVEISDCNQLVLDFDEECKNPLVSVDENFVELLKPHQKDGVKFMWEACFESCQKIIESTGTGCILAHCMGLGK